MVAISNYALQRSVFTCLFSVGFVGYISPTYTAVRAVLKTYTETAMTFDARDIKQLQPGQHITSPDHPGLRLEAFADRRTWTYRYRSPVDGKLRQVKVGTWPAMSLHAAIAEWETLRDKRAAGADPALEAQEVRALAKAAAGEKKARAVASRYTVACVCDDYWAGHVAPNRAKKGVTEVRRMFDKMLGETGTLPAAELSRSAAFDLIKRWAEVAPVQAGRLRCELGAAWDYAIDAGRLPETCANWWRLILRGKIRSKGKAIAGQKIGTAKRVLTPAEAGALIRWLPNFSRLIDDALTMYLWTCTRGVEILGAEGKEIAEEGDGLLWWVIPKAKTKNARVPNATDLRVPLFGRARAIVLRRKEQYGSGLLFPARRRDGKIVPVEQKTIQATVWMHQPYSQTRPDEYRLRLTVTHWAPHDLRRTSRTFLAAMSCPNEAAESIIGHMLPGVVGVYNQHSYDAERVEWLKRLSDYLEGLAG